MCNTPWLAESRIRMMPDMHASEGCTVGTSMTLTGRANPAWVGGDIGCGMQVYRLEEREIDFAALDALIRSEIQSAGGVIPFWRFMELALYAPGLGYYSAGATKFGAAGDFITAPELGPLFAECVAEAVVPVLQQLGPQAHFVEVGGGSGRFAGDAITRMAQMDALPARYSILEPSADLRERQGEYLRQRLDASQFRRVHWLERPPQDEWHGVLFANEVIDALPTPRFAIVDGEVMEEHVALDGDGGFKRVDRPADALLSAAVRHVERQLPQPT